eukprot:gene10554-2679_t
MPPPRKSQPLSREESDRATVEGRKIYIQGLPLTVTEKEIEEAFASVAQVVENCKYVVVIPRYRDSGKQRGFAFAVFKTREDAQEALNLRVEMGGRVLNLSFATPRDGSHIPPQSHRAPPPPTIEGGRRSHPYGRDTKMFRDSPSRRPRDSAHSVRGRHTRFNDYEATSRQYRHGNFRSRREFEHRSRSRSIEREHPRSMHSSSFPPGGDPYQLPPRHLHDRANIGENKAMATDRYEYPHDTRDFPGRGSHGRERSPLRQYDPTLRGQLPPPPYLRHRREADYPPHPLVLHPEARHSFESQDYDPYGVPSVATGGPDITGRFGLPPNREGHPYYNAAVHRNSPPGRARDLPSDLPIRSAYLDSSPSRHVEQPSMDRMRSRGPPSRSRGPPSQGDLGSAHGQAPSRDLYAQYGEPTPHPSYPEYQPSLPPQHQGAYPQQHLAARRPHPYDADGTRPTSYRYSPHMRTSEPLPRQPRIEGPRKLYGNAPYPTNVGMEGDGGRPSYERKI